MQQAITACLQNIPVQNNGNNAVFNVSEEGHFYLYAYSDVKSVDVKIYNYEENYSNSINFSSINHTYILDLGIIENGCEVSITCYDDNSDATSSGIQVASFDEEIFIKAYETLNTSPLEIEIFKDTYISGNIESSENGLLFTSIPYDYGWSAYIDGEKVESYAFKNALLTIRVPEGTHYIEFKYFPKGLLTGIIISVASLLIFILIIICNIYYKRRKNLPDLK